MPGRHGQAAVLLRAAPLYAGPLLAGWAQGPAALYPLLVAIFLALQLLPGGTAQRGAIPLPAFLALLLAVQLAVVGLVWGAGAALARLTGPLSALPSWVPPASTLLGAALWLARRPAADRAGADALLDRAIEAVETGRPLAAAEDAAREPDRDPELEAACNEALNALWELPAGAPVGAIDAIVQRLEERIDHRGFPALASEIGEGFVNVDLGLLRYLASPAVRARLTATAATDLGFALSALAESDNGAVLHELVAIAETLLDEGAPVAALPAPDILAARGTDRPALAALAVAVAQQPGREPRP